MDTATQISILALIVTPAATILGIWLTNKSNFQNLEARHKKEAEKEKIQREYELKVEIYRPILSEIINFQQLLAGGIQGNFDVDEYQTRTKALGLAVSSALVTATPNTLRLLQKYIFLCLEKGNQEIFQHQITVPLKFAIQNAHEDENRTLLTVRFNTRLAENADRVTDSIAELMAGATEVLLAIRDELAIDTNREDFVSTIIANATDGKRVLNEIANQLRKNLKASDTEI